LRVSGSSIRSRSRFSGVNDGSAGSAIPHAYPRRRSPRQPLHPQTTCVSSQVVSRHDDKAS